MATILLIFILLLLPLLLYIIKTRFQTLPLPPGPKGYPIIGNILMNNHLTHRGLMQLSLNYGGLLHLRLGFLHTIAISTPQMAQQVLQHQDLLFSNRPATLAIKYLTYNRADMAFAHYGPFWRQMRKLCVVNLFSRHRAESWSSVREEIDKTIQTIFVSFSHHRCVNHGETVFNLTKNITFRAAFGSQSHEEQDKFIEILQEFSKLFGAFNVGDFIPWLGWLDLQGLNKRLVRARVSLDKFIDRIIDEHMKKPKAIDAVDADMVDVMLAFLDDDESKLMKDDDELKASLKLTRDNIKAIIMDVMFGGTETVASAIEWAMAELLHSPGEMAIVQAELASVVGLHRQVLDSDLDHLRHLKRAIKETLRLHPPIPLLLHETSQPTQLSGFFIPSKSRVMINAFAIGRDPSSWKDPNSFRPSRFAPGGDAEGIDFKGNFFELIPFGSGRRSCPGMQLGLYGLELAVAQLLHCFTWELPDGMRPEELDMEDVFGLTAPKAVRLCAVPTYRLTCSLV
ncbi:cytochrome P450 84A1-like [Dioscorea cayenensis subsp. rotundata]|uniref:Cytochrome P450 84A1-like n=1 Tax=Dioscorea cayennensis subsp. rotundata TaxID=55577 RepID=A0AB40CMZ9_DIOCR|nr:cytochrome P450 84A1-like [Dioscorea cayenensis subsp. rotundata]